MHNKVLQKGDAVSVVTPTIQFAGVFSRIEDNLLYMWTFPVNEDADVGIYVAVPINTITYIGFVYDLIPLEELEKAFEDAE